MAHWGPYESAAHAMPHQHQQHTDPHMLSQDQPSRSFLKRLFRPRERQYPYIMQPDGSLRPDARPYGSRSIWLGILVITALVAALILLVVIGLGPSSLRRVYYLQICSPNGCDQGSIRFGLFTASVKRTGSGEWETSGSSLGGWSGILENVQPLVLRQSLPENEKVAASLIIGAYVALVLSCALFAWALVSMLSYNRKLSHGTEVLELIPDRDRSLSLFVSGCVFSLVPLALIIAATVTLSNDAARSIAKFEALTTYAGSWVFDHAERGPDFCMLWAVVGVIGASLVPALYIVKRAAEPIAGASQGLLGPPTASGQPDAGYHAEDSFHPSHWYPHNSSQQGPQPRGVRSQHPMAFGNPPQFSGHVQPDLEVSSTGTWSSVSSTSTSVSTIQKHPTAAEAIYQDAGKPAMQMEERSDHPQVTFGSVTRATPKIARVRVPSSAKIEEIPEDVPVGLIRTQSRDISPKARETTTANTPAAVGDLGKSTKGKHKKSHPAHRRLQERLPSPGSAEHPMEGLSQGQRKTSSASSFDALSPPPPVPVKEAEDGKDYNKKKKQRKDPFEVKPLRPLHTMQEQYHPEAAARDQQKRRKQQGQYTSRDSRKASQFTPSRNWHGDVNVLRRPPGMAPPNQQRPGLAQQYRYPGGIEV